MVLHFDFRDEGYEPPFIPVSSDIRDSRNISEFIEEEKSGVVNIDPIYKYFPLIFVDGVMRREVNMVIEEEESLTNFVLYSMASGAVLIEEKGSTLLEESIKVKRVVLSRSDFENNNDAFKKEWSEKFKNTTLENIIIDFDNNFSGTNSLRRLEEDVINNIETKVIGSQGIIILDGNLQLVFKNKKVIGLIKTINEIYLSNKDFLKLRDIKTKESRSGIFIINKPEPKYSWYVRLTDNKPWFYNMVRLEAYKEQFSEGEIRKIADFTACFLPELVNNFDIRTPQNLAPVSFLEKSLKTRLGHSDIIKYIIKDRRD